MNASGASKRPSLSSYTIRLVLLGFSGVAGAQTQLIVADAGGAAIRTAPAVVLSGGMVAADRAALVGANRAWRLSTDVAAILSDDQDAGVVLLRLPGVRPVSRFHDGELESGMVLAGAGFASVVEKAVDVPGFGLLFRLRNEKNHPAYGAPLWNEKGEVAAWYIPKNVDGQRFSFAIPIARLRCLSPGKARSIADWNQNVRPRAEEQFSRSLGYFWVQDFEGAAYHFGQFVRDNGGHARGWFYLAFSEGKVGHDIKKLAAYRRAIELSPAWGEPRYNLGLGLLLNGKSEEASAQAAELSGIDPVMGERLTAYIRLAHIDPMPVKARKDSAPASPPPAPR
ncbi:MAG: hypothetical protein IT161_17525 [Bryobacterales bacterium]|nr:hypothetical protein [Bryobacterales bacterium]